MKLIILVLVLALVIEGAKKEDTKKSSKKADTKKAAETKKKVDPKKKAEAKRSSFSFVGKDMWGEESLKKCYKADPLPEDYFCYKYYRNYEPVYIDPLNTNPIIIIYRRFIPKKFVNDFLRDVERRQKRKSESNGDEDFMAPYLKEYKRRRANETIISHSAMSGVARVFRRAQALIPMLNFTLSGPWQVLSFKKGGHQAPHYDYITYSSPDQFSKTTRKQGNRFVTFSLTLKAADIGGETVFVHANHTVSLEPGDVLLFTNINKDMTPAIGSAHAECPVQKGEKITATLWLRPKGQELFYSHSQDENLFAFDMEKLIAPNMDHYWKSPYYDLFWYQQMMMQAMTAQLQEQEAAKKKKNPFL